MTMEFADYVAGISFRFLPPERERPTGFRAMAALLRKIGIHLEVFNTRLPCEQWSMRRRLKNVCRIPRMSTFAIGAIINRGVSQLPPGQAFVNVGVWNGYTLLSGMVGNADAKCIGVDNFSHNNSPRDEFLERFDQARGRDHEFHERDYREYFADVHSGPIGFYLFDGPHTYRDQLDGLKVAEPFFAENCIVMVDDSNWDQVRRANFDFMNTSRNQYRVLLDKQTPASGHPTFWNGLMIFQLVGRNKISKLRHDHGTGRSTAAA